MWRGDGCNSEALRMWLGHSHKQVESLLALHSADLWQAVLPLLLTCSLPFASTSPQKSEERAHSFVLLLTLEVSEEKSEKETSWAFCPPPQRACAELMFHYLCLAVLWKGGIFCGESTMWGCHLARSVFEGMQELSVCSCRLKGSFWRIRSVTSVSHDGKLVGMLLHLLLHAMGQLGGRSRGGLQKE